MKSVQEKIQELTDRTSGFADPRLVVVTAFTDIDDPSTWTEHTSLATTNRPSLSALFGTIQTRNTPDATDHATASEAYRAWPTSQMDLGAYGGSGGNVQLLAVVDGTGALSSSTKASVSDTPFAQAYTAIEHIIIAANSQTSTEK